MSKVIDLCRDGDDNGKWPNTASLPSLPFLGKRTRGWEEASYDTHPRNENGPGNKTTIGSASFVFDLELAEEVDVSPYRKRRGVMTGKPSGKNAPVGKCAQILKGVNATEKDVDSEDAQVVDHRASHEGIASAAASHPMNSDSEQASENDSSAYEYSEKQATPKPPSNSSGQRGKVAWEYRLSELAIYRKIFGHCNVPQNYSENSKLGTWVATQRRDFRLHLKGKTSHMAPLRIQELESLGFEWDSLDADWEDCLSELADYRQKYGHCDVSTRCNATLANWVQTQRFQYMFLLQGTKSTMTLFRLQKLEILDFEWDCSGRSGQTWADRMSEFAEHVQKTAQTQEDFSARDRHSDEDDVAGKTV
jgi:hypothetical protein